MSSIENRVRQELKRLDEMEMPDRLSTIRRSAGRQRLTSFVAAGAVVGVLAAATLWGARTITSSDEIGPVNPAPHPSESTRTFGSYEITFGGGFDRGADGAGTVEIDSHDGTACFQADVLGATSAHLHSEGDDDTVVVLFEPPEEYRREMCALDQPSDVLQSIIDEPEEFYVDFHNEASGETLSSQLEPHESMASCPAEAPPFLTDTRTAFRPRSTHRQGDRDVMPVVFPDGSTAELVYPTDLRLDELAARPGTTGGAPGGMIRPQISHGGVSFRVSGPVDCIEGRDGKELAVWRWKDRQDVLVMRFGDWYVSVFDRSTDLGLWARRLRGEVVDGWLVLRGSGRLLVGPEQGSADSEIMFWDARNILNLWPLDCGTSGDTQRGEVAGLEETKYTSFCVDGVEIHAQGDEEFVRLVAERLRVRNLNTRFPLDRYEIIP